MNATAIRARSASGWLATLLMIAGLLWAFSASAQVSALAAIPSLTGPVVDTTGTLTATEKQQLEQRLLSFSQAKGSQVQVLMVPSTQPEDIAQYGIRVAEAWKIGRKAQDGQRLDDGVILIVAKDDRRMRIEVGYGLEGAIPDAIAARIIEEFMRPAFRAGDFAGGVSAGVEALITRIEGEDLPEPKPPEGGFNGEPTWFLAIFIGFFVGSIVGPLLRAIIGRPAGATLAGLGAGGLAGFMLTSLAAGTLGGLAGFFIALLAGTGGGRGRGGWYHGPVGGGWSSGGSSSGGGWSGGGGGFGGGGASGGW
jgi:uncharacterized protein